MSELLEYLKKMKQDADRMNAQTISFSMIDCLDLDGWSVHISMNGPDTKPSTLQETQE